MKDKYDVVIIGGGAVGSLTAYLCGMQNLSCLVIEKNLKDSPLSLAIGITPPSLEILRPLGIDQKLIKLGLPVTKAFVHNKHKLIGGVSFKNIPGNYPFILSLEQNVFLKALREEISQHSMIDFLAGCSLEKLSQSDDSISITIKDSLGNVRDFDSSYLIACDGEHSYVRSLLNLPTKTKKYPPHFVLADFYDKSSLGKAAHLFFSPEGSVESFPLSNQRRRWILQIDCLPEGSFTEIVKRRCLVDLKSEDQINHFSFQTKRQIQAHFYKNRVIFAGNAAHIMSPVGGQGLNTGIADAEYISKILPKVIRHPESAEFELKNYQRYRMRAFNVAANRAAMCMWMGTRKGEILNYLRMLLLKLFILRSPLSNRVPSFFAMQTIPYKNYQESFKSHSKMSLKAQNYLHESHKKSFYNEVSFTEAAPRYNFATRAMSLFRDRSWKEDLIRNLPSPSPKKALDLACGTGDITFLLNKKFPESALFGIDLTQAMLDIAIEKNTSSKIAFMKGKMENLPFEENTFDLITGSYALRNAGDLESALKEITRVLAPGGTAAFLDFAKPSSKKGQKIQYYILKYWCGLWGFLLHRNPEIHGYIADSLSLFPTHSILDSSLSKLGLEKIKEKHFYFGTLRASYYKNMKITDPSREY